jgi:hypothetical protein
MEGSKAFSKEFMSRHGIPTARYQVFSDTQFDEAVSYVKTCGFKVVLKADGLAAGKGVLIPENEEEAVQGLRDILVDKKFGGAGELLLFILSVICSQATTGYRKRSSRRGVPYGTGALNSRLLRWLHHRSPPCCSGPQTNR